MDYGKAIRMVRSSRRFTQAKLGRIVGNTASYMGTIERKKTPPGIKTLDNISKGMSIPPYLIPFLAAEPGDHEGLPECLVTDIMALTQKIINRLSAD